jgi:hypothetical protein
MILIVLSMGNKEGTLESGGSWWLLRYQEKGGDGLMREVVFRLKHHKRLIELVNILREPKADK